MRYAAVFVVLALAGCASHSGIVPIGKDTYMVAKQQGTGFSGLGNMKMELFKEAHEYCQAQGKSVEVVATNDSKPPYVLGNFPRTEVQFMCLGDGEQRAKQPLTRHADTVIEIR